MKRHQRGDAEAWLLLIIVILAIVAAVLGVAWSKASKRATVAETNLLTANGETKACNDSITGLEEKAYARGRKAEAARNATRREAEELQRQAQTELSTPATVPGDDCRSSQDRVTRILSERKKP